MNLSFSRARPSSVLSKGMRTFILERRSSVHRSGKIPFICVTYVVTNAKILRDGSIGLLLIVDNFYVTSGRLFFRLELRASASVVLKIRRLPNGLVLRVAFCRLISS